MMQVEPAKFNDVPQDDGVIVVRTMTTASVRNSMVIRGPTSPIAGGSHAGNNNRMSCIVGDKQPIKLANFGTVDDPLEEIKEASPVEGDKGKHRHSIAIT